MACFEYLEYQDYVRCCCMRRSESDKRWRWKINENSTQRIKNNLFSLLEFHCLKLIVIEERLSFISMLKQHFSNIATTLPFSNSSNYKKKKKKRLVKIDATRYLSYCSTNVREKTERFFAFSNKWGLQQQALEPRFLHRLRSRPDFLDSNFQTMVFRSGCLTAHLEYLVWGFRRPATVMGWVLM